MSTKVGDIFVRANLDDKQYKKGLNGLGNATSTVGKKLAKALTVTAVASGLTSLINKVSILGDTVDKTSQKLGMSMQTYQQWDYIMQRNGASIESMTVAMKTLATSVETGKDALAELGITAQEAMGMSQEQLFERVVTALQGVEDVTHRTYLAGQLLGRGATELGAVLNLTAEDMDNLKNRLFMLGGVMSDTAVRNSAMFRDALTDVKMAFRGVGSVIAEYVLPILTSAINNYIIPAIISVANALRALFSLFGSIGGAIRKGANAVKGLFGKTAQKDVKKTGAGIGGVGDNLGGVGKKAKGAKKQVQALKRELLGFDKITKLTGEQGTGGGGGVGGGGGLGAGGIDFSEAEADVSSFSDMAKEYLSNIELPPALTKALADLRTAFSNLFDTLANAGKWAYENVLKPLAQWTIDKLLPVSVETLAQAFTALNEVLKLAGTIIEPLWNTILKPFLTWLGNSVVVPSIKAIGDAFEFVGKTAKGLNTAISDLKSYFEPFIESAGGNIIKGLYDGIVNAIKNIPSWIKANIFDPFIAGFKSIFGISSPATTMKPLGENIILGVLEGAKAQITNLVNWFKTLPTTIKNAVGKLEIVATIKGAIDSTFNTVKSAFNALTNSDAVKTIKGVINSTFTTVKDTYNNLKNSDTVKTIKGTLDKAFTTARDAYNGLKNNDAVKTIKGSTDKSFTNTKKTYDGVNNDSATKTIKGSTDKSFTNTKKTYDSMKGGSVTKTINAKITGLTKALKKFFGLKAGGGVYKNGRWSPIQRYAGGGAPNQGQLFWARENGAELVGTLAGHTAVMNNDQIVASVSAGVAKAIAGIRFKMTAPPLASTSRGVASSVASTTTDDQMLILLAQILTAIKAQDTNVYLDGEQIKNNVVQRINNHTKATGQLELIV